MSDMSITSRLDDVAHRILDADERPEQLAAVAEALDSLPALRLELAGELRRQGFTNADIAELAGVSRARIAQLLGPLDDLERRRIIRNNQPTLEEVTP